ncbi:hypothetical protein MRX96_005348 [Rhipicephalus microplus]
MCATDAGVAADAAKVRASLVFPASLRRPSVLPASLCVETRCRCPGRRGFLPSTTTEKRDSRRPEKKDGQQNVSSAGQEAAHTARARLSESKPRPKTHALKTDDDRSSNA